MSKDDEIGHPIFYVLHNGRVIFWDGLIRASEDFWDGKVMRLETFEGEVDRELRQGPFDALMPIGLTKNWFRPYPMIRLGNQN